jgi:hypothetical protein
LPTMPVPGNHGQFLAAACAAVGENAASGSTLWRIANRWPD